LVLSSEPLRADHRAIEIPLDLLAEALQDVNADRISSLRLQFEEVRRLTAAHLEKEEQVYYPQVRPDFPLLVAKMEQQHAYIRELEQWLAGLLASLPETPTERELDELRRCGRQFQSMLQHHMLEEERELFRLADQLGRQA
jgi:hemerythrin-like domain-containing protein